MIRMTLADVAAAVGGTVRDGDPAAAVSAVSHHVTTLGAGALYVCMTGDPRAGRAAGAGAVLADRPLGEPAVVVNDVLMAYRRLALALTVGLPEVCRVAVTGGASRAAAARLTAHVLHRLGPTVASAGPIGRGTAAQEGPVRRDTAVTGGPGRAGTAVADVYGTLLRADEETRFLVAELDGRRRGGTAGLLPVVRPAAGVVLSGNDTALPGAAELVAGLGAGGVVLLDADDPATAALAVRAETRVVTFGRHRSARVRAERVVLDGRARARFVLQTPVGSAQVELRLHGEHLVPAALAAAAVALEHTHDVWLVADALGSALPDEGTGVRDRADGVTVLDDAGDATPESVLAAMRTAVSVAAGRRRTIAVLGAVTQAGDGDVTVAYDRIRLAAARLGLDEIVAVGVDSYGGRHVADREAAAAVLGDLVRPGDVVLVAGEAVGGLAGE